MTIFFLPGKEDDILTSGRKLGITGTAALWFAFVLVSAFMPDFKKKTEYKTVRITLASVPVERTVEPAAVPEPAPEEPVKEQVQAAAAEPENVPAQVKKTEPAKKAAAARKQEPAQTSGTGTKKTTPAKTAPSYKKSVEELMAEQSAQKEKDVQWDDSLFADSSAASSSTAQSTPQAKQITGASALSGTSAAAAQQNDGPVSSTSAAENKKPGSADASTKAALGAINNTTYTQSSGSGASSQTSVKTGRSSDGKVTVGMSDGTARTLLYPAKPSIQISEENAKKIDSSRTVKVKFKVLEKGNVPLSEISIEPTSTLTLEIQKEIRDQVSQWLFTEASSDGDAVFTLTIIKK